MGGLTKFFFGGLLGAIFGFLVSPKRAQKVREALFDGSGQQLQGEPTGLLEAPAEPGASSPAEKPFDWQRSGTGSASAPAATPSIQAPQLPATPEVPEYRPESEAAPPAGGEEPVTYAEPAAQDAPDLGAMADEEEPPPATVSEPEPLAGPAVAQPPEEEESPFEPDVPVWEIPVAEEEPSEPSSDGEGPAHEPEPESREAAESREVAAEPVAQDQPVAEAEPADDQFAVDVEPYVELVAEVEEVEPQITYVEPEIEDVEPEDEYAGSGFEGAEPMAGPAVVEPGPTEPEAHEAAGTVPEPTPEPAAEPAPEEVPEAPAEAREEAQAAPPEPSVSPASGEAAPPRQPLAPADLKARIEETRKRIQRELEQPFSREDAGQQGPTTFEPVQPAGGPSIAEPDQPTEQPPVSEAPSAEPEISYDEPEVVYEEVESAPAEPAPVEDEAPSSLEVEPAPVEASWAEPAEPPAIEYSEPTAEAVETPVAPPETPQTEADDAQVEEMIKAEEEAEPTMPSTSAFNPATGEFDQDAMRRRIEETRNRLKAKAFDAMMNGEGALLARDSGDQAAQSTATKDVDVDTEVEETIETTLSEEDF